MNDTRCYLALSYNEAIGPVRYEKILDRFPRIQEYFELPVTEQMRFLGIKSEKQAVYFERMLSEAARIEETCLAKNISVVHKNSPDYPPRLRDIPDAPFLLYRLGRYDPSIPYVAVVGTRNATPEAAEINRHFSRELVSYGVGIVSGMAKGHDTIAQKTALDYNGTTVAVLGTGIDVPYPEENADFYSLLALRGAIFSEYPPGTGYHGGHFPRRNRIISGLADAVLVVQAPKGSGALYTAQYAAEQKREAYFIPASPIDPAYAGSTRFLANGAKLALDPSDIVADITGRMPRRRETVYSGPELKPHSGRAAPDMPRDEKDIWDCLDSEKTIDQLAVKCGKKTPEILSILTRLELKELVTQYPGGSFIRKG